MGINGILPRVLPSAGQENYNLRSLRDGLIVLSGGKKRKLEEQSEQMQPSTWKRRKVRLAVDLHGWISRACHGNGVYLMDERHLSYHGRAMLKRERDEAKNDSTENHINKNNVDDLAPEPAPAAVVPGDIASIQQQQRMEYIQKVIHFIMNRISYLQNECNVEVLLVLDGATPPIKKSIVNERRNRRKQAAEERDLNLSPAKGPSTEADEAITTEQEALNRISASKRAGSGIDPALRSLLHSHLLNELRANELSFLISPYEADGQLAHLSNSSLVDGVITEDSDLICLGVRRLIYKLGGWNGENSANRNTHGLFGTLLERNNLGASSGIDLLDFSDGMLVVMFVAAGCDYCESLRGIGIVTARDIVENAFFTESEAPVLERVLHQLYQKCHREARDRLLPLCDEEKDVARSAYEKAFLGAIAIYRHPLVYDPILGDTIANDVSSADSDSDRQSKRFRASPEYLRDEQILMQYEPYRRLVTDREALYQVVGRPRPLDLAKKMARGNVNQQNTDNPDITVNSQSEELLVDALEANKSPGTQEETCLEFHRDTTSANSNNQQPSSQEFTVLDTSTATQPSTQELSVSGRGTQQSKSSSDKTLSSLSPDLLATPSPGKRQG